MLKKVELIHKPFLLIVDPLPTFSKVLAALLRRAGHESEIIAFQEPQIAHLWLSGLMDCEKAEKYPFTSPWDAYPPFRRPTLAVVNLAFPAKMRKQVLSTLWRQQVVVVTTSTEEVLRRETCWDERYWSAVVTHILRPLRTEDVLERLLALLASR